MSDDAASGPLMAFRRLLADAQEGGQAKVDALVALAQRRVLVATWSAESEDFRTLVSSDGQSALPLFTDEQEMREAARRFGWFDNDDAQIPHRHIDARAALQHLAAHGLDYLVIDITADHSLEAERAELEPLLQARGRADETGPFAAVGRVGSSMLQVVRPSSVPPPGDEEPGANDASADHAEAGAAAAPESALIAPERLRAFDLPAEPPDALLAELSALLRGYPEVEWALFLLATPDTTPPGPVLGLRVDRSYRDRLDELVGALGDLRHEGQPVRATLLDGPAELKAVRPKGLHFYPFRRRA